MTKISDLKINYIKNPSGIKESICLSWAIESEQRNVLQENYQIQVNQCGCESELLYDSGVVESGQSVNIPLGLELKSIRRYDVRVRVTAGGEQSQWAEAFFISALTDASEWKGQFVSAEPEEDHGESYGTLLRKEFTIHGPVKEAWLVSTAHGLYHCFLNGRRISLDEMAPGWTSYGKRLLYQTYQVTDLLQEGSNALGVMLGAGWYKGLMGYKHTRNNYGTCTAFGGQLIIRYEDGSEEWILSDKSWKGSIGPILFSEIYDGEIYDARQEQPGWNEVGFQDEHWQTVRCVEQSPENLYPQSGSPVRVIERRQGTSLLYTPEGDQVLDFGQNLTGWCEFSVKDPNPGEVVELQFFETLDCNGNVYQENLRAAKETIRYICKGEKEETYHPWFTFQGFRYGKVVSYPGEVRPENFIACVVHSDMEMTGTFRCSNPLLNRLWNNVLWGMKGNFLDIPTDCPQRDERLGWTGDAQIFGRTASYLMNTNAFYHKWLADVAADQREDGAVPHIVPDILTGNSAGDWFLKKELPVGASGWADVAVMLPWVMYLTYEDKMILERQIDSILGWVRFMQEHSEGCLFQFGSQFGDWLALDAEEGSYQGATPVDYTCSVYYCRSTEITAKILRVLERDEEAAYYESFAQTLKDDFRKRYFEEDGMLKIQTQTAYVLALVFGLVPEMFREKSLKALKALLEKETWHLTTGFLGTPQLLFALSENGCLEGAYELLLKEDFPSWLYQVKAGATTIWEHWDGRKSDGSMWSPDMNSFNHYAYGSVGEWLYRVVTGLEIDEEHPGYEHFYVRPSIGGGLGFAETTYRSVRGYIRIFWKKDGNDVTLEIEIPVNTSADIILPQAEHILESDGLVFEKIQGEYRAKAGSGKYEIHYWYEALRSR